MESTTYMRDIRISPKKMRMLLNSVKTMTPVQAREVLRHTPRKSGTLLYGILHSAITNAVQTLKVSENMLQFKSLAVDEGRKMRRYRAGSRGMARPYVRKYSHVKVVLKS